MWQSCIQTNKYINIYIYTDNAPDNKGMRTIYIVQSERTTNSRRKLKGNVEHGVPSTEESAGDELTSSHALAVSARSLAVGDSEIYALLLNNG